LAHSFRALSLAEVRALLNSPVHEERHLALLILVLQVAKCDESHLKRVYDLYLGSTRFINNWDLVDCSAPQVVGGHLMTESREPLLTLAKSTSLWERRIAVVSTQHLIRRGEFGETTAISELLLGDGEGLIHKATGWMLREVGRKDQSVLEGFLDRHATDMPRTMLRYAVEKFPPERRRAYLGRTKPTVEGAADGR